MCPCQTNNSCQAGCIPLQGNRERPTLLSRAPVVSPAWVITEHAYWGRLEIIWSLHSPFLSAVPGPLHNKIQQVFPDILCINRKTKKFLKPATLSYRKPDAFPLPTVSKIGKDVLTSQQKDVNKCHLTLPLQLQNGFGRTFPTPPTLASVWAICKISKLWKWVRVEGKRKTQKGKAIVEFLNIFSVTVER